MGVGIRTKCFQEHFSFDNLQSLVSIAENSAPCGGVALEQAKPEMGYPERLAVRLELKRRFGERVLER